MSAYATNHYVLILQNNYTKQTFVHDVLNTSTDTLFYKFEGFEFDDKAPFGEYNYVLFWCTLDYNLELSNSLLDSKITVEKAKEISLKHANLKDNQVVFDKTEMDYDNGVQVYDIEFHYNNIEYNYEIDANTGNILSYSQD